MFAFLSGSPFVLIEIYGVAPNHYGYYFGISALMLMLGASTNKRLLQWMPGERVMRYGSLTLILGGAAAVAIPYSPLNGPLALTVAIMIYIFGQMLVQPNAVAAALMPLPHMAGTGSALMGMMQMLFGAVGGYAVNALYDGTPPADGRHAPPRRSRLRRAFAGSEEMMPRRSAGLGGSTGEHRNARAPDVQLSNEDSPLNACFRHPALVIAHRSFVRSGR